jgi:mRNA interferase MazF
LKRGDIFWAKLSPRSGAEQHGDRPVVVVSHDGFNQVPAWRSVIVVPLSTSEAQARRGPTAVLLAAGTGGLKRASAALCHQVTTVDRGKLTERIGALPAEALARIGAGLRVALDIDD